MCVRECLTNEGIALSSPLVGVGTAEWKTFDEKLMKNAQECRRSLRQNQADFGDSGVCVSASETIHPKADIL